jgi:SecD/SecF fusion protein
LKNKFPERAAKIDKVVVAYDAYYPFRGWLDTPSDLQRLLKGTGILEFRVLPTEDRPEVDLTQMKAFIDNLQMKGPKDASDDNYIWFEVEKPWDWRVGMVGMFGNKSYVLASNKRDECILYAGQNWMIVRASPGQDSMGRRAIDFKLDEHGGALFANVTGKNIDRPLCILLDNIALSAPKIMSRIYTRGQISGSFTQTEVEDIVRMLNAGSLPARLIEEPISVRRIAPRSGANTTK